MDWVAENAKRPAVVSMSVGGAASVAQNNVVSKLHNAGVTVVVSAGNNDFSACRKSPASAEKVKGGYHRLFSGEISTSGPDTYPCPSRHTEAASLDKSLEQSYCRHKLWNKF